MLAVLAIYAGASGLFGLGPPSSDILATVLPEYADHIFEAVYLLSGVLMIAGIASAKARIEGPGWALLGTSVLVRFVAYLTLVGFSTVVSGVLVLYALTFWACYVRIRALQRGDVVVVAREIGEL